MSILTLPPELLAAIIGHLDTTSTYNLHAAGVACIQGLVTECRFSANALATASTLNTDFFIGVSGYLKVLNLSGVPDLDRPRLLDALTIMKCLVDLDVSYTNINMADFLEIDAAAPTLRSIAINFAFIESNKEHIMDEVLLRIKNTMLPRYQQALERFENVHFVGKMHARVHGALALLILARADLNSLTLTTTGAGEGSRLDVGAWRPAMVNVAQFQLFFFKIPRRRTLLDTSIYSVMDFKQYEVIIFCVYYRFCEFNRSEVLKVFATPVLKRIIGEHFGVEPDSLSDPLSRDELGARLAAAGLGQGTDFACFFWDKDRTKFDSAFRSKLLKIFKKYYVFSVEASATPVPADHDWCRVTADSRDTLDYNAKFLKKQKVKLKIVFNKKLQLNVMPKIDNDRDLLKKITHLSLSGAVPGDPGYFKALFESCSSLETLQLALGRLHPKLTFLQNLKEAKRLRNFLMYHYSPEQTCALLTYLTECGSLENICLYTFPFTSFESLPDLVPLLSKLSNLYNFCMNVSLSLSDEKVDETCRRVTSDIGRDALRVVLLRGLQFIPYHPYLSVFNLVYQLNPNSRHDCNVSKILTKR